MELWQNDWLHAVGAPADPGAAAPAFLSPEATAGAQQVHRSLAGYRPTPLVRLDGLARRLGVRAVFVKDESHRFGLNAFKGLGGLYALFRLVCRALDLDPRATTFADLQRPALQEQVQRMVFVTATDGNHGKGVAWAAGQLGCEAHVLMPRGSSPVRARAIRDAGCAEVTITDLGYDDAVREAARLAQEKGWILVQDTSWPGYEQVPRWIIQGYTTMAAEAADQLAEAGFSAPTHVLVQAGVGAMAGGVLGYLAHRWKGRRPQFATVEPDGAACIYQSALAGDGAPHAAKGSGSTIMAGLNCGEPCMLTWPVLRDLAGWYLRCPDWAAACGMRLLAAPATGDQAIVSGESGAATAGALGLVCSRADCRPLREKMGLDEQAVVLLFSTEGDTDPENYRQIVYEGKYPLPAWQAGQAHETHQKEE